MSLVRTRLFFSLSFPKEGEGWGEVARFLAAPLSGSLPAPPSRGEREAKDAALILRFTEKRDLFLGTVVKNFRITYEIF